MIRRALMGFLPAALVLAPWAVMSLLGARQTVPVITGMLPTGMGPEAFLIGFAYVAAQLVALLLGPPLLFTGAVGLLRR